MNKFKIGDTVTVDCDWCQEIKHKRAKIAGFQQNGDLLFASLFWIRDSDGSFAEKYGTKFALNELRKVTNDKG